MIDKEYKWFKYAHKEWAGKEWEWKKPDGSTNHPMDGDKVTRAFYVGFCMARKGQTQVQVKIKELKELDKRIKEITREVRKWRKQR